MLIPEPLLGHLETFTAMAKDGRTFTINKYLNTRTDKPEYRTAEGLTVTKDSGPDTFTVELKTGETIHITRDN